MLKYGNYIATYKYVATMPPAKASISDVLYKVKFKHHDEIIEGKKTEMFKIADNIKTKENVDKQDHKNSIEIQKKAIKSIKDEIETSSNEMELVLVNIGIITNDKNDYEKRKELQAELDTIPTLIQNI